MPSAVVTMLRLVALVAIVMLSRSEAIPCPDILNKLAPCANFIVKGGTNQPSQACCNGIKDMNANTKNKPDRVQVCECLKQGLASFNYDPNQIPLLPKDCGIADLTLPPIDKNTDCNMISLT